MFGFKFLFAGIAISIHFETTPEGKYAFLYKNISLPALRAFFCKQPAYYTPVPVSHLLPVKKPKLTFPAMVLLEKIRGYGKASCRAA